MTIPVPSVRSNVSTVTKVALVDDHAAIIEMLTLVVELLPRFKVVHHALEASTALTYCQSQPVDILVLDLVLPGMSGLELLANLQATCPHVRVLVFTGNLTPTAMRGTLSPNVFGVVEKMAPLENFRQALQAVAQGQTYFGPRASTLIKDLVTSRNPFASSVELTHREKTVLRYIAQGLSSKEIAHKLNLSLHTVVNHRSNLMKKTGLRRVAQLSLYAANAGLISETTGS